MLVYETAGRFIVRHSVYISLEAHSLQDYCPKCNNSRVLQHTSLDSYCIQVYLTVYQSRVLLY